MTLVNIRGNIEIHSLLKEHRAKEQRFTVALEQLTNETKSSLARYRFYDFTARYITGVRIF